jgi:hypothetical protein
MNACVCGAAIVFVAAVTPKTIATPNIRENLLTAPTSNSKTMKDIRGRDTNVLLISK